MNETAPRRNLGFGLFTLAMMAIFIGLGVWQLERRVEKHALIAALTERLAADPVPLPPPSEWNRLTPPKDEFRRVQFSAVLDAGSYARVYSNGSAVRDDISGPGTWQFWPATLQDGQIVVVNMGFAPDPAINHLAGAGTMTRFVVRVPSQITGYLRFPESAGLLTPSANVDKRLWFARDVPAMVQALGWGNGDKTVAPFYVDLEKPVLSSNDIAMPGPLHVHLKDDHMQYAITWFSLAGAVLIAFLVWWRGKRRNAA